MNEQIGGDAPQQEVKPRYSILAKGQHELEIVAASVGKVEWKVRPENPQGECLRLRLSAGSSYGFVFVDAPSHLTWLYRVIGEAVGLDESEVDPERLVGRRVTVEIDHYTRRDGTTGTKVAKWLPHPDTPTRPARQPKAKPAAKQSAMATAKAQAMKDLETLRSRRPHMPSPRPNVPPPSSDDDFPF